MLTYTERMRRRRQVWWGHPGWRQSVHRLRDRYQLRDRTWPMARWRCCDTWQRSLLNKWNSREFAAMHGVAVPELYWSGRRIGSLPLVRLPENFVLRPAWGAGGVGIYLMAGDYDHGSQRPLTREAMVAEVRRQAGPIALFPYLAEEFLATPDGKHRRLTEYKVYLFGGHVAAIQCIRSHRTGEAHWAYHCAFDRDWTPLPESLYDDEPHQAPTDPPARLDQLLRAASTLGAALNTFIRADFYLTAAGPVFGEFSSTPRAGQRASAFADRFFGQLWQDLIPDAT